MIYSQKVVKVRHAHTSGRYDRSPRLLGHLVRKLALVGKVHRDVITLTEVDREDRAAVMRAPGWQSLRGSGGQAADESGIMWRKGRWDLVAHRSDKVAGQTGPRSGVWVLTVLLRHRRTGALLLVSVAHLAASVEREYDDGRPNTRKAAAHKASATGWANALEDAENEWGPDGVLVAGDFNLDYRKPWVRHWAKDTFGPDLRVTWAGRLPKRGTHGRRVIDWALSNLRPTKVRLGRRHAASDHVPFTQVLHLPTRKGSK